MKTISAKMKFTLESTSFTKDALSILNDFFTHDNSKSITASNGVIVVDTVDFFIMDNEFFFYEFFNKSQEEIENKLQLYKTLQPTEKNKYSIIHKYEASYEKFKVLLELLTKCSLYSIQTLKDNGEILNEYSGYNQDIKDIFIF